MRNSIKTLAAIAALGAIVFVQAAAEEAPAALTVDQAVAAAVRNNLSLKSADLAARAKKRASDFSFNKFYPTVSASTTALRMNSPQKTLLGDQAGAELDAGSTAANSATYYYGLSRNDLALSLTVQEVFSPSYILMINQAAIDYQTSALDRAKAEKQMKAAVKETFYQLLVQKEAIALTKARLDNASEQLRQAKISYELGNGTELDYMNTKANAEGLVPQLRSMETARKAALAQFQETLGLDDRPDMELSGSLDDEKISSADEVAPSRRRFDVLGADLSVKQLESSLRLQDSSLLPSLILQYKADPTMNDPSVSKLFDSDNYSQSSGALSLTISWDLSSFIPGSDYYLQRHQLKEQLELAKESERQTRASAMRDEQDQLRAVEDGLAKIENLRNVVEASKRAYELTEVSYKAGAGRYLDLQSAEISLQSSQIQLLNSRLDLLKLLYDLEAKYRG